ncbi:nuclear cap-binding protein subunit 2-like [Manis javanica]|uniref:nuclear cap-binding protein subunit 2-like n=1 Tax=Manis javanica TaxID=9974 RepID=UPI0018797189|nr:nuclear cap-binding protein subunit 2-like [Manis javanica]KAI5937086.1 Nuclear cap-binding protein subunit 2 [Manis javanica]
MSNDLRILQSDSSLMLSEYWDQQQFSSANDEREKLLKESLHCTWGIFPFKQLKSKIHELFSSCGDVRNTCMGMDRIKKTAGGFCFVEYHYRADAENAMWFLNGTFLGDRIIHTDWNPGFREGRQYDHGHSGSQ